MWAPTIVLNEVKQNPGQPMDFGRPSTGAPFHSLYNDRGAHLVPHFHPFCPELQHLWPFNSLFDNMKKIDIDLNNSKFFRMNLMKLLQNLKTQILM